MNRFKRCFECFIQSGIFHVHKLKPGRLHYFTTFLNESFISILSYKEKNMYFVEKISLIKKKVHNNLTFVCCIDINLS